VSRANGLYVPLVTPFDPVSLELDLTWIGDYLRHLERAGAEGVLVLGTTGEFPLLGHEERRRVVEAVLAARGSLRVLVGANATSIVEARALLTMAADGGADGALLVPSYYYPRVSEAGVAEYVRRSLEGARVPVYLYHIPQVSGVGVPPSLAARLRLEIGVAGVKDSSGSPESLEGFCAIPGFRVFVGNDRLLLRGLECGAHGAITAASNVFPEAVGEVLRAWRAGEDAHPAQERLDAVRDLVESAAAPSVVKFLLELRGFPPSTVRPPLRPLSPAQSARVRTAYEALSAR